MEPLIQNLVVNNLKEKINPEFKKPIIVITNNNILSEITNNNDTICQRIATLSLLGITTIIWKTLYRGFNSF